MMDSYTPQVRILNDEPVWQKCMGIISWLVNGQCYTVYMCGVLHVVQVWKHRCIAYVEATCVIHMFYTCNTGLGYTHVLHMYF